MLILRHGMAAALLVSISACSDQEDDKAANLYSAGDSVGQVVAVVEGSNINELDLALHMQQIQKQAGPLPKLDEFIEEVVNLRATAIAAEKLGYLDREDVKAQLRQQRDTVLANAYIADVMASTKISEEEILHEYKRQLDALNSKYEYNASHILLDSRDDAMAALERIHSGEEFGRIASDLSTGTSAENGGELGWFESAMMVPEFSAAVEQLKKGQYTREPVKTNFGWHVIRLNDKRKVSPPEFETVKETLRNMLIGNRLNERVQDLRNDMDILVFDKHSSDHEVNSD